jgi:hypothetical protein
MLFAKRIGDTRNANIHPEMLEYRLDRDSYSFIEGYVPH